MILFQMVFAMCTMYVFFTLVTLLFGISNYTKACLLDIKSSLERMDNFPRQEDYESRMLGLCKEVVVLHARWNR